MPAPDSNEILTEEHREILGGKKKFISLIENLHSGIRGSRQHKLLGYNSPSRVREAVNDINNLYRDRGQEPAIQLILPKTPGLKYYGHYALNPTQFPNAVQTIRLSDFKESTFFQSEDWKLLEIIAANSGATQTEIRRIYAEKNPSGNDKNNFRKRLKKLSKLSAEFMGKDLFTVEGVSYASRIYMTKEIAESLGIKPVSPDPLNLLSAKGRKVTLEVYRQGKSRGVRVLRDVGISTEQVHDYILRVNEAFRERGKPRYKLIARRDPINARLFLLSVSPSLAKALEKAGHKQDKTQKNDKGLDVFKEGKWRLPIYRELLNGRTIAGSDRITPNQPETNVHYTSGILYLMRKHKIRGTLRHFVGADPVNPDAATTYYVLHNKGKARGPIDPTHPIERTFTTPDYSIFTYLRDNHIATVTEMAAANQFEGLGIKFNARFPARIRRMNKVARKVWGMDIIRMIDLGREKAYIFDPEFREKFNLGIPGSAHAKLLGSLERKFMDHFDGGHIIERRVFPKMYQVYRLVPRINKRFKMAGLQEPLKFAGPGRKNIALTENYLNAHYPQRLQRIELDRIIGEFDKLHNKGRDDKIEELRSQLTGIPAEIKAEKAAYLRSMAGKDNGFRSQLRFLTGKNGSWFE